MPSAKKPAKPPVSKQAPVPALPPSSSRDTSPTVAKTAAKLMHDPSAAVRSVAASALAQAGGALDEKSGLFNRKWTAPPPLHPGARVGDKVLTRVMPAAATPFNADDFTRTIVDQCVGEIAFNFDNEADVAAALSAVATMDGYVATAKGLHVTVRQVVDG